MPLIVKDRVRETTTTTGTGTLTLIAPVTGFQSFSVIGNGNTTYYSIVDVATGAWEVGIGTYTSSGTTLSRDTVLESSTGGAKVSFSSGTKDVFCTYPAERSVSQADVGTDPNEIPLNQYLGSMAYQDRAGVNISGGVATLSTATVTSIQNDTAISNVEPSLMLNFAAVEALDPRISYTRASTATYYNGVTTAVAEQNLYLQSQTFENASWAKSAGATVTANTTTAPDGTVTADTLVCSAGGDWIRQIITIPATALRYTHSIYVKENASTAFTVTEAGATASAASFTLSGAGSVSVTNNGGSPSATITDVGSGWYRCTFSYTTNGSQTTLTLHNNSPSAFIWGAQLEQRSAVSAYTPTTTQTITNYIPVLLTAASGVPRFDHNPISGDSLGFLVEESRTNLLTYSEDFANAAWNDFRNSSISSNTTIAPDGTLTADKLVEAATTTTHFVQRNSIVTISNATTYTATLYAKAAGRNYLQFMADAAGGFLGGVTTVDLLTGTVVLSGTNVTASVISVGNGWYRCSFVATSSGTTARPGIGISSDATVTAGGFKSYTGDGYSGIYIWGAQLEAGAFATSYIPTVASQVTRAADNASMTGTNFSSWFNNAEGTVYCEATLNGNSAASNHRLIWISNNTTQNFIAFDETGTTNYRFVIQASNISQATLNLTVASTAQSNKLIGAYKFNDFAASANAGTVGTDTSGDIPMVDRIDFGSGVSSAHINGTIKKIAYYPRRLSNEELQEMTS